MKLYAIVGSPNSRKVQAVINHAAIDIELEYLDLFAGDTRRADFMAVNPNAMVPALVDGDLKLWESNAIIQYLADKSGCEALYPRDLAVRADINRWLCWELAHFNKAFGSLAFEAVAKPNFMQLEGDAALIDSNKQDLARFAAILEEHLRKREFLVGDTITLADYAVIHVEFFKDAIPFDWSPYPYLNAYFERMRISPHWLATAPKSNEAIGRKPV